MPTFKEAPLPQKTQDAEITEPDYAHRWITSLQPHFTLLQVSDPNVRNLQTVLFNVEADRDMRRRALKQLAHNAKRFDSQDASAVLQQWASLNLELE